MTEATTGRIPLIQSKSAGELFARVMTGTVNVLMGYPRPRPLINSQLRQSLTEAAPDSISIVDKAEHRANKKALHESELVAAGVSVSLLGLIPTIYKNIAPIFPDTNIVTQIDNVFLRGFAAIVNGSALTFFPNRAVNEIGYKVTGKIKQKKLERDVKNWARSEGLKI